MKEPENTAPKPVTESAPTPAKRKNKSKPTIPSAPRVIDPDVARIKKEAAEKIKELRKGRRSAKLLQRIICKLIPKLITGDVETLLKFMSHQKATPALLKEDA